MNKRFSDRFSSQWVKVRFYNKKPGSNGAVYPSQIRFCEALKSAITKPIIIEKKIFLVKALNTPSVGE
jgi:hypothetical protein